MFSAPFDYHRPGSIDEAIRLLSEIEGARVLAGGHSLIPAMKFRLASPAALVDISRIAELRGIESINGGLRIGASTTHAAIAASDAVRNGAAVLAQTAANIGDLQVRNRGTIGGSLAHADPGADYPTVMLALDGRFTAMSGKGTREIAAREFFLDLFTTALKPGEILTSVLVPATNAKAVYLKHRHPASSFAVVGVAALVRIEDDVCAEVRIACGGATATPTRAEVAERILTGQSPTEENLSRAAAAVGESLANPISDSYASGEYRVHLATVMAKRALWSAAT